VLERQKETGELFGETMKSLNMINDVKLSELLELQIEKQMKIGEILVGLLYLNKEVMENLLVDFLKEALVKG
ncbi:MAG: hypothetical protein U9N45_07140, partial [Gemmatimonadota bacterium]|nr:hypothetical protein [Gemmatimonadota bacterium]